MGYQAVKSNGAIGNGGAGTAEAWDIISDTSCDLEGRVVTAFMSLDEEGGTFDAMEEETTIRKAGKPGVSEAVKAKYLGYTYPQYIPFEGRYTTLTPSAGMKFKVWFLK